MKLQAALGSNFCSTFQTAMKTTNKLQGSINDLRKAQSDISAYKKTEESIKNLREEKTRLENAGERNEAAIARVNKQLAEQEGKLSAVSGRLKSAGVDTNRLAEESERLKKVQERVVKSQEDLARATKRVEENKRALKNTQRELLVTMGKVAAASAAVYKAFIQPAANVQAQFSNIQASANATAEEMAILENKAASAWRNGFSQAQIAEVFGYMADAGWNAEKMAGGLDGILTVVRASGDDMYTVTSTMKNTIQAFGLSSSEAARVGDVLVATTRNSYTSLSELGDTFKYVAPVAASLGFAVEDTAHMTALLAENGIKGSQAGTALRATFTGLLGNTRTSANAMKALGVSTTNSDGSMRSLSDIAVDLRGAFANLTDAQQAQYAAAIAGQGGMSGLLAIVNTSEDDYNRLAEAISNSNGVASEMAAIKMDNFNGQMQLAKSAVLSIRDSIGNALLPYATKALKAFTTVTTKVAEFTQANPRLVATIAGVVGGLAALKVGILTAKLGFFSMKGGVLGIVKTFMGFKAGMAQTAAVAALGAGKASLLGIKLKGIGSIFGVLGVKILPLILIMSALAAVFTHLNEGGDMAGFIAPLLEAFEEIRPVLQEAKEQFKELGAQLLPILMDAVTQLSAVFHQLVADILPVLVQIIQSVVPLIVQVAQQLLPVVATLLATIVPILAEIIAAILPMLLSLIEAILPVITQLVMTVFAMFVDVLNMLLPVITELIQAVLPVLLSVIEAILPIITQLVMTIFPIFVDVLNMLLPVITELIQAVLPVLLSVIEAILPIITQLVMTIFPIFVDVLNMLLPVITELIQAVLPVLISVIEAILPIITQLVMTIFPIFVDVLNLLLPVITELIQMVLPILLQLIEAILPVIIQLVSEIFPLFVDIINMLLPPIFELIEAVLPVLMALLEALMPIILALADIFTKALGAEIERIMPIIDALMGAILVLANIFTEVLGAEIEKIMSIIDDLMGAILFLSDIFTKALGAAIEKIMPIIDALMGVFSGFIEFITDVFTSNWGKAWEGVKNVFKGIVDGLVGVFKLPINIIIEGINCFLGGLNNLKIPDWIPGVGGLGINIPLIPKLEKGSNYTPDTFIAGDVNGKGGELVTNARGRKVFTAAQTGDIFRNINAAMAINRMTSPVSNSDTSVMPGIAERVCGIVNGLMRAGGNSADEMTQQSLSAFPMPRSGEYSFKIEYSPIIHVSGEVPGDLEEKLRHNNETLLQMFKEYLRQQREDEGRMRYD
jgi:TP901 family phage tail tape measure protein